METNISPQIQIEHLKNKEDSLNKHNDVLKVMSKLHDNMILMANRIDKLEKRLDDKK